METLTVVDKDARAGIEKVYDSYTVPLRKMYRYLDEQGIPFTLESVRKYINEELDKAEASSTYNVSIYGIKKRLKLILALYKDTLTVAEQERIEKLITDIHPRESNYNIAADKIMPMEDMILFADLTEKKIIKYVAHVLARTGLRISECLSIQMKNVKRTGDHYVITVIGKRKKDRQVFLSVDMVDEITDVFGSTEYLFQKRDGSPYRNKTGLCNRFKRETQRLLGVAHSPHDFRHSFIQHLVDRGLDHKAISKAVGHASVRFMLDNYTHRSLSFEDIQKELPL